jgi:hypothetical protein
MVHRGNIYEYIRYGGKYIRLDYVPASTERGRLYWPRYLYQPSWGLVDGTWPSGFPSTSSDGYLASDNGSLNWTFGPYTFGGVAYEVRCQVALTYDAQVIQGIVQAFKDSTYVCTWPCSVDSANGIFAESFPSYEWYYTFGHDTGYAMSSFGWLPW